MTNILTALEWETKFAHIATFQIKGRMDISVERNVDIRMTKDFTERFNIKAYLNASCGKSVARSMVIRISNPAISNILLKTVLHCSRFNILAFVTGQDKGLGGAFKTPCQINDKPWQWNISYGALAFGLCNNNLRF